VTQVEQNKAAARAEFEVWNSGELQELDEFVAAGVVHHDPHDPLAVEGLAGLKTAIRKNRARYPDFWIAVEDQVAEGDKVATRWIATMTHEGKPATLAGITIVRFKQGKIVESWRSIDRLSFLQEIGAVVRKQPS
jgi:predicted ester cyclase